MAESGEDIENATGWRHVGVSAEPNLDLTVVTAPVIQESMIAIFL